jgi:hypothetical protein
MPLMYNPCATSVLLGRAAHPGHRESISGYNKLVGPSNEAQQLRWRMLLRVLGYIESVGFLIVQGRFSRESWYALNGCFSAWLRRWKSVSHQIRGAHFPLYRPLLPPQLLR